MKDSSSGWDCISSSVVKKTSDSIISPLVHVFNLSIIKGVFPSELKIARVVPLYKSGDPLSFSNYRPVSILPLFSKILERLMYERLDQSTTQISILLTNPVKSDPIYKSITP